MNKAIKLGLVLMIYCAIAGLLLGWVFTKTKPKMDEQAKVEQELAIREVMPEGMAVFEEKMLSDSTPVYVGYGDSAKKQPLGYAVIAVGSGFSDKIKTMVGITTDFRVARIKVLSQSETPGLGTKTQEDSLWRAQFIGKSISELYVDKDGGKIASITGSTISSRAVADPVREMIKKLQSMQNELPQPMAPEAVDTAK